MLTYGCLQAINCPVLKIQFRENVVRVPGKKCAFWEDFDCPLVSMHRWSLFTRNLYSFFFWMGGIRSCLCRQVVFVQRWSLTQVGLLFNICTANIHSLEQNVNFEHTVTDSMHSHRANLQRLICM